MNSGPIPGYADTIPQSMVEELCPVELKAFVEAVANDSYLNGEYGDEEDATFYLERAVQDALMWEGKNDLDRKTNTAWNKLRRAFKAATGKKGDKGLELYVSYYDEDMGGYYDEIRGPVVWSVGGVYVLSAAGKRFKDRIERKFYTQCW